jgi:hypothetical protein
MYICVYCSLCLQALRYIVGRTHILALNINLIRYLLTFNVRILLLSVFFPLLMECIY